MKKNRLYLLLGAAITGGYMYLAWALAQHEEEHSTFSPCLFKNVTGIACPSCGSTRSVLSIINGNFTDALLINPLGFVVAAIMLTLPVWLLYDMALKKDTLLQAYKKFEKTLQIKWIAITLILLIIANWIWNITKGL
jgi:hypothetical protein